MFVAQAASACHWKWTAMGDDQRSTEGGSRRRGMREPVQQATDVLAPRSYGPITIAIRARFDYDSSTIQHPTRSYVLSSNNEHVNSFPLL